jgi:hypothetical protein
MSADTHLARKQPTVDQLNSLPIIEALVNENDEADKDEENKISLA